MDQLTGVMRWLIGMTGLFFASSAAFAADVSMPAYVQPAAPSYNWTGIYIGANAGYGFATPSAATTLAGSGVAGSENLAGFVGGGQLGGNYQIGSVVFGLEADFDYSGQSHSITVGIFNESDSIPWLGTLRGRIGYALNRVLFYGTAGGAEGKFSSTIAAAGFGSISGWQTHTAWTAGAGAEIGLTENLSAR